MLLEILRKSPNQIPVHCITDNYSLYQTAHSTTSVGDRRLRIELAIIREAITEKDVNLTWVQSKDQLADCFTKKGADTHKLIERVTKA